jgi:SAM-dependent methyltransferase
MGWIEYWDDKPTIYVSQRHREAHYRCIADGIGANLGDAKPVVLDYGCGEALSADVVARKCKRLYLCDAAPSVRAEIHKRFTSEPRIIVVAPDDVANLPGGSVDLVVANSVLQYLPSDVLEGCLEEWRRVLAPSGRLLLADIIPPSVGPLTDATALLSFAWREGFALAAITGLVRTLFSDYRKIRAELGLQQYEADTIVALLNAKGFSARRHHPNLGHNQARMAFIAVHAGIDGSSGHVA